MNSKLKLFLGIVIASAIVYFISRIGCGKTTDPIATTENVVEQAIERVVETVTIHDTIVITRWVKDSVIISDTIQFGYAYEEYVRDTVLVRDTLRLVEIDSTMRMFVGNQVDSTCTFSYQAGIKENILASLRIEANCVKEYVYPEATKYVAPVGRIGIKAMYGLDKTYGVGLMYNYHQIHTGINYDISNKNPSVEIGYFINTKKK